MSRRDKTKPRGPVSQVAARSRAVPVTIDMRASLRMATDAANAEILTGLRDIIRCQVASYSAAAREGPYSAAQATALHKLASTYRLLAAGTAEEQGRYSDALERLGSAELDAVLEQARELAGDGD